MTRIEQIFELSIQAQKELSASSKNWMKFLETASRMYKYGFPDQLLIFMQRPDATACANFQTWDKQLNRSICRGAKKIGLLAIQNDRADVHYVFDIADTVPRTNSPNVNLWTLENRHMDAVLKAFEQYSDAPELFSRIVAATQHTVASYWDNNKEEILNSVEDSFLEEYDEITLKGHFCNLAAVSVQYAVLSRCDLQPERYFSSEDFPVYEWNTPNAISILGTATAFCAGGLLRQIERTIKNYERENERSNRNVIRGNQKQHPIRSAGGLSRAGSEGSSSAREITGQIRLDETEVSRGTSPDYIQQSAAYRGTDSTSPRSGRGGEQPAGAADAGAGKSGGRDGAAEGRGHDEVGRTDEQLQGTGGGDHLRGTDLRLTESRQEEAEDTPSSASSIKKESSRYEVIVYHHAENGFDERADCPTLEEAEKVAQRYVDGTMESDGFQYDGAAVYDLQEKKYLRTIGDYPDRSAQEQIQALSAAQLKDASQLSLFSQTIPLPTMGESGKEKLTSQPVTRQGDIITIGDSSPSRTIDITVSDAMWEQIQEAIPEQVQLQQPVPENFRITDDSLGTGGPKEKFWRNTKAIAALKQIERENRRATPEEQHILSQYVGWGGLPDAFDPDKPSWAAEYSELKNLLTESEYASARSSTLNAHYTSPTVIKAIYDAVGSMGFQAGNILEPACGVGNFFGLLPESMAGSRLYGVELDSISGRIARQLYPKADITISGFETTDRRDFFDLAIGNVPFGNYQVNDKAYNKLGFSIHNYFFAKSLDQVRPGGIVAFVTSRYTMDAKDSTVRRYLAQRAELLGAIRLPNNAFRATAGTDVVSDIIFFQKRDRRIDIAPEWTQTGQTPEGFTVNQYFIDHPEMVLGQPTATSTQYGRQDYTIVPIEGLNLAEQLQEAVRHIHGTYQAAELDEQERIAETVIPADPDTRNYSFALVNGEIYFRENSVMIRKDVDAKTKDRICSLIALRTCDRELIDLMMDYSADDAAVQSKQAELSKLYDSFVEQYGRINSRANAQAFSADSSYYLLCGLEVLDDDREFERKADIFTKRTIRPHQPVTSVDTAMEALTVSIAEKACVDMDYMTQLSRKTPEELENELSGVIYRDIQCAETPEDIPRDLTDLSRFPLVTADEYLSGNVRRKLRMAQALADALPPSTQKNIAEANVRALQAVQPRDLDASEIEVRLGATWIDKEYIQQFMMETLSPPSYLHRTIKVSYSPHTAEWNISAKTSIPYNDTAAYVTYGTRRASAYRLLEEALNLRDIRIYDTVEDANGKETRVLNVKETTLAAQKQDAIREAFKSWIWKDPERRRTLVHQYNELMNSTRPREYDGSKIVFAGMNPEIELKEHQRNAIARMLYGGNTLLAHVVGAGKTFEMAAAAMESKRLGLCQKSLFAVPNHLTEQWKDEFLKLYPAANILVTTKQDFEPENRKKFCARIATGDYDAVIIGHSQFEKIPISRERQERLLHEQIDEIAEGIAEVQANGGEHFTVKQLERTRKSLETRLEKLQAEGRKDNVVTFEQLGVDRLFVDEAHSFKNLFLYTKMRNVAGLSTSDAQKSSDMFSKCRYMDEITGNRGVIFATGTPVSNSMTELYTMQRYLQYDRLQELNMTHFDCWASRFGETVTALELAPEGTGYRARTRFSKFFNLPELMNLFKEVADIKTADQLDLPTPEVEYHTIVSQPTEQQKEIVQMLSERASKVHSGTIDPSEDNMLKITSDGRKLGLDQRILNPLLPDEPGTKVNQCVDDIVQIWQDGAADKLTQLVFCDISTPQASSKRDAAASATDTPVFSTVYEDIRQKLIAQGIPNDQIAFIHDANSEVKKKALFRKVREGKVRILMGSTAKMGAGTNVQDRLIALHDLDCPWRPSDLEQRKGRIERQGNQNKKVHVYRYVTEGTFDAYLWQTVENKQKFISQIMTSKSPVRSFDDVDETALSFAEIKALCAGDPRIKERMDLDVDVARLKLMKADHQSKHYQMEDRLHIVLPKEEAETNQTIEGLKQDIAARDQSDVFSMRIGKALYTDKKAAGEALLEALKGTYADPKTIGMFGGFTMKSFLSFGSTVMVSLNGKLHYNVEMGVDARGNITRMENALRELDTKLERNQEHLTYLQQERISLQSELEKPFPKEDELNRKQARLNQLTLETDMKNMQRSQSQKKEDQCL